jgi:Protein kinase domain/FHA domain
MSAEGATQALGSFDFEDEFGNDEEPDDVGVWGTLTSWQPLRFPNIKLRDASHTLGRKYIPELASSGLVSSVHCRIFKSESDSDVIWIEDLSTNGTFVDGKRVGRNKRMVLPDTAELALTPPVKTVAKVDRVEFRYEWLGNAAKQMQVDDDDDGNKCGGTDNVDSARNRELLAANCSSSSSSSSVPSVGSSGKVSSDVVAGGLRALEARYLLRSELGRGAFATVRLGIHRETGQKFAIKIIDKKRMDKSASQSGRDALQDEIDILKRADHPNIIGIKEVFDSERFMYLVLELVTGGELFDRIIESGCFAEPRARAVVRQMVDAVRYLHDMGIVHRDLKVCLS